MNRDEGSRQTPAAISRLAPRRILPAYQQVAHQLREHIISGRLAPGNQLPIEPEIAELFGVSRSTIREALRQLSSEGLVRTTRGVRGGTFVAYPSFDSISAHLETGIGLLTGAEEISIASLLEARILLEVPAAGFSAVRRSEEALKLIHETAVFSDNLDVAHRLEMNRGFHARVLSATGNELLEIVAIPIFQVMTARLDREDVPATFWRQVEADHLAIYNAIAAGDAGAAESHMRAHLERIRPTYMEIDRGAKDGSGC
ncbi:GntR family transcriptional regulator [Dactylosporangium sp. NPDC000555]|uniref:FadR/GntR family transcriptional regulator n=1 Tax=Dactylosporangium sp. NPDC000555 TaxID=3154260 RepID=UPI00332AEC8C